MMVSSSKCSFAVEARTSASHLASTIVSKLASDVGYE